MNWEQIYEGWRNKLIPPKKLKKLISETAAERLAICRACEFNSKNRKRNVRFDEHCTECGCTLSAKTRCLSCECPLKIPKWDAVISFEQEQEINGDEKES